MSFVSFKTSAGSDREVRVKLKALGFNFTNGLELFSFAVGEHYLAVEHGAVSYYPLHEWRAYDADSLPELSKEQILNL